MMRQLARAGVKPVADSGRQMASTVGDYNLAKLRGDLIAGLTVSVIAVPQCMAYAIVAGLPPSYAQYGLYAVIFQCLIGAVFNSQPLLSVGPNITQSLLVASTVTRIVDPGNPDLYLQMVIGLTMVKGLMQLVMFGARLGNLVRYVSQSVIVGFTAGAGVLIAFSQIGNFLGISVERTSSDWPGVIGVIQRLWPHLEAVHWQPLMIGAAGLGIVIGARRISRVIPGPLIAIVVTTLIVFGLGWTRADLAVIGEIGRSLPVPTIPSINIADVDALLAGGLALALLGLMEAYSISKTLANKTGGTVSADQELFSQGMINFGSSFLSCIPGSGSFSRSALNHFAGARTLFANLANAGFVLLIFLLFAPAAKYVPMACLAAILFVIGWNLIDWGYLRRALRTSRADLIVCLATLIATLTLPLAYAVFIGIFLNIALYLRRASQLQIQEMVPTDAGPFLERPLTDSAGDKAVVFLQLEGDLFFALADELQDRLDRLANSPVRVVILRLKRTHSIDATVLMVVERFVNQMHQRGAHVVLCGVRPPLMSRLRGFGLVSRLGEKNVFETTFGVFTSAKQALTRSKQLLDDSIDVDIARTKDPMQGWAYQI